MVTVVLEASAEVGDQRQRRDLGDEHRLVQQTPGLFMKEGGGTGRYIAKIEWEKLDRQGYEPKPACPGWIVTG